MKDRPILPGLYWFTRNGQLPTVVEVKDDSTGAQRVEFIGADHYLRLVDVRGCLGAAVSLDLATRLEQAERIIVAVRVLAETIDDGAQQRMHRGVYIPVGPAILRVLVIPRAKDTG